MQQAGRAGTRRNKGAGEEQRQLSGEKLKDREQQAADLQLQLSRAEEQVLYISGPLY